MPSRRGSQANEEAEAPAAGGFLGAQSMYAKMLAAKKAAAAGSASDAPAGTAAAAAPTAEAPAPPVLSLQTATPPKKASLLLFGATNYEELGKKSCAESGGSNPGMAALRPCSATHALGRRASGTAARRSKRTRRPISWDRIGCWPALARRALCSWGPAARQRTSWPSAQVATSSRGAGTTPGSSVSAT